jgi:starch synthase
MPAMRIVMVASSASLRQDGGLADVVDALPEPSGERAHGGCRAALLPRVDRRRPLRRQTVSVASASGRASAVMSAIRRPSTSSMGRRTAIGSASWTSLQLRPSRLLRRRGTDYPDNAARFTLLRGPRWRASRLDGQPVDVLHGHDWEAGPALLALQAARVGPPPKELAGATGILTCHNLAYHGWTSAERTWQLGDRSCRQTTDGTASISCAAHRRGRPRQHRQPGFARESLGAEMGAGVDDLLRGLGDRSPGIVNGIDTDSGIRRRTPRCRRPSRATSSPARPASVAPTSSAGTTFDL